MAEKQILPMCEVELKSCITTLDFKTSTLTCTRYLWPKKSLDDTQINSHISSSSKLKIKLVFFLHVLLHKVLIFYSKPNFPSPHCCEEFNQLTFICVQILRFTFCVLFFFFFFQVQNRFMGSYSLVIDSSLLFFLLVLLEFFIVRPVLEVL